MHVWLQMKIEFVNKGLIFNLSEFGPFAGYTHAQSPQLLKMDGFFRIYFSSRKITEKKYPESEILFVDFEYDFSEIVDYSRTSVLASSAIGSYDEHGVFPINPIIMENGKRLAYLSGWSRRVAVPVETAIGLAESLDGGLTFKRLGTGPVLAASPTEPFLVGDPFVIRESATILRMFYIAGKEWKKFPGESDPQRIYKIRSAFSNDGISWIPDRVDLINDELVDECQALPSVTRHNGGYLMAFCYRNASGFRNNPKRGYRLGFAYSKDLINWNRRNDIVTIGEHGSGWDKNMRCYPNLTSQENRLILLYNGNKFGVEGFGLAISGGNPV